jgi:fumarate reductase flavoprotein subunit
VLSPVQRSGAGLKWNGFAGDVALKRLEANFRSRQGRMLRGTRVTALKLVPNGIEIETAGGEKFKARSVVIADGGFQANTDLFRRFIGPTPERVLQRGAATGRGDGLAMALDAGAASAGMGAFYGHLMSRAALTNPRVWPYPELDGIAAAAIVVGPDGRRLLDEGLGGIAIANALARLQDPASATIVCDADIWVAARVFRSRRRHRFTIEHAHGCAARDLGNVGEVRHRRDSETSAKRRDSLHGWRFRSVRE